MRVEPSQVSPLSLPSHIRSFLLTLHAFCFPLLLRSGGFSNYMYLCSLPRVPKGNSQSSPAPALAAGTGSGSGSGTGTGTGSVPGAGASPERVIVRFFGEILLSSVHSLVLNSVIFAILSERGIGPRLYGVFPGGRIEQYLEVPIRMLLDALTIPSVAVNQRSRNHLQTVSFIVLMFRLS